ncbi:MAG: DHA2 family efflux MFS transporter permease subunit [Actinobacteria bacterium]|nr:DHA2 family efflux MFS transporter permease subunit [Actinomycetota bacterium]
MSTVSTTSTPTVSSPAASGRDAAWTLGVVCTAVFMLLLDVTIVAVALADMRSDLSASLPSLQWVVDAYTLTLAGLLLTAATLGDRIGRKRVFVAGLALFTVSSLACALAADATVLDAFRAIQGIGAALLFGTAVPLLGAAFPTPAGRARAIGVFGATLAGATAIGPLVGGALVSGPGWRWIFLINVPIGVLTLLACLRLRESRTPRVQPADWPGTFLLTAGLFTLLLALIRGNDAGWTSPAIVGLLVATVALLGGFVARELAADHPMLDLRMFARPAFSGVSLSVAAIAGTLVAATYYIALYLQNGVGLTPFETGVRVLPLTVASFVAAPVTAVLLRRTGTAAPNVVALVLAGSGLLLAARVDATAPWAVLVPGFVVAGVGLGIGSAASITAALASVEPDRAGMATGSVNTARQVGTAAGVAALGALFQHTATARAGSALAALPLPAPMRTALADGVGSGGGRLVADALPASAGVDAHAAVTTAAVGATADALATVLTVGGVTALALAAVCAVLLWPRAS